MAIINYKEIDPFYFKIEYQTAWPKDFIYPFHHNHDVCEIYVHLKGDLNFLVENNIYPVSYGDVIITKPYENHHAFNNSDDICAHYWILFSCKNNEGLFDIFFNRKTGENNLLVPDYQTKVEIISYCNTLCNSKDLNDLERYLLFFKLIYALSTSRIQNYIPDALPEIIQNFIKYITENISEQISIEELAKNNNVSIATLERAFKQYTGLTPSKFILNQRLSLATSLLRKGESVSYTALTSGFPDDSNFIKTFKKAFGMTPFNYKKTFNLSTDYKKTKPMPDDNLKNKHDKG